MNKFAAVCVAPVSLCLSLTLAACGGVAIDDDGTEASAAVSQSGQVEYLLTAPVETSDATAAATALSNSMPNGCQPISSAAFNNRPEPHP